MNFKKETYDAILRSGHSREDVMFIGSYDGKYGVNMDTFDKYSDFYYENGFGSSEIAVDLIIYFKDKSYIKRGEYDGSEWWEYDKPLIYEDKERKSITNFGGRGVMWESVEDLNGENKGGIKE